MRDAVARMDEGASPAQSTRYDAVEKMPSMTTTPEGYLRGEAIVTRPGVFTYRHPDGSTTHELRHPNDVFESDSLDTMRALPGTMNHPTAQDHPKRLVTADNAKRLSIGYSGDGPRTVGGKIALPLTVTDGDAVRDIKAGKTGLSMGYTSVVLPESGTFEGQPYTHRQTQIRYNHWAVVGSPRAGDDARMRLDSGEAEQVSSTRSDDKPQVGDLPMTPEEAARLALLSKMQTTRIDGIEYRADPEVIVALSKLQLRIDAADSALKTAEAAVKAATAETDKQKGRADSAEADLKKLKDGRAADIAAAVTARVTLLDDAALVLGADLKRDGTEREIMAAVIEKSWPGTKLDGASEDYVRARFDVAIDAVGDKKQARNRERAAAAVTGHDAPRKVQGRTDAAPDANASRQKMIDDMKKDSRGETVAAKK